MSLCPSNSCIVCRSVPCSSKCVAKEWRSMCTCTRCLMPARCAASFSTFTNALAEYCSPGVSPSNNLGRKERITAFLPLAHDANRHCFTVDVLRGQVKQFASSKSGRVNQRNHAVMLDVGNLCKDALNFILAQHFGQALVLFGTGDTAVVLPFAAFHLLVIELDSIDAHILLRHRDFLLVHKIAIVR